VVSTPSITQRERWKYILIIGGLQTLQPFSLDPYLPSGPIIARGFDVPDSMIQLTFSALTLGFALGQLITGPLSDSIGRRKPMLIGSAAFVIATILVSLAPNLEMFFVARFVQGIAGAAVFVVGNAVVRDLYEGLSLLKVMSRVLLIQALSWFIGPFAGSQLLQFMDWRGVSLVIGSFAVLMLITAIRYLPETLRHEDRRDEIFDGMLKRFKYVLKDRIYVGLLIISSLNSVALWAYLIVTPFVLTNQFDLAPEQFGLILTLNSFGAYLGVQASSKLAQKIPAQWILLSMHVISIGLGATLLITSATNPPLWLVMTIIWIFVFSFGMTVTPIGALSLAPHGNEAGTAASLMAVITSLALTASGPLYASLSKQDMSGVGVTIAILHVLALIAMVTIVNPRKVPALK
jgi:DHA1 family bicyclomycin/chloramphenicol resistance-like MFS transporter